MDEDDDDKNKLILLDAIRGKWEFPELKKEAKRHYEEWEPDICLIEARAAGHPLIYELRQMNIPIQDVAVGRGGTGQPQRQDIPRQLGHRHLRFRHGLSHRR